MDKLLNLIKAYEGIPSFESLKTFIKNININELNYQDYVKDPEHKGDYGRNILAMEPFECVLINWPTGVESAVHLHNGLFGYVWVLEGELDNLSYKYEDGELIEFATTKYVRNGLIPEPDGVIHKLCNNSDTQRAVTLHFYYPAIKSFDGMEIYNLATGDIGNLSDNAHTASWIDKPDHFKEIRKKAFTYISYEELNKHKSHVICNVIPKPSVERINAMNASYFCEQAAQYDFSDFNQPKRKSYIETINKLVAEKAQSLQKLNNLLDIATGTGRRAINIKKLAKQDYAIVGVDISPEMCKHASDRGIETYNIDWANDELPNKGSFDLVTFLYAFGHVASENERIKILTKIANTLNDDGIFCCDIFSLSNKNEWGPLAENTFETRKLDKVGYQKGDVFYRKLGHKEIAFLHYFDMKELKDLFEKCGLEIIDLQFIGYAKNPGEFVENETNGNVFVTAKKA